MATRRQEKVARVVKEAVSDAVVHHLSDPRIEGFISVTRVEMAPDLRNAEVFLSIFGEDEVTQKKTFKGIEHARVHIQSLVASKMKSKFSPVLHFHLDDKLKKTMEMMKIINETTREREKKDSVDEGPDQL